MNLPLLQVTSRKPADTRRLGETLGRLIRDSAVLALCGDFGCGKTVLVQGLAAGLDVPADYAVTSPSFTLINEYSGRLRLIHVDLYRIEQPVELEDLGLEELMSPGRVMAIEWADRLPAGYLQDHVRIDFEIIDDFTRRIQLAACGQTAANLLQALENRRQPSNSR